MINTRRTFLMGAAVLPAIAQTAKPDIFQAAAAGDTPRVTELLAADPQLVRARSADGRTPLHFAVAAGKTDMLFVLMTRGADLSAGPESPLLTAVDYPDHEVAYFMSQALLANASDPNARNRNGKSALDLARARKYNDIVELLIHRGAAAAGAEAAGVERVHFERRHLRDLRGNRAEIVTDLPFHVVNPFVVASHADFAKVKQLLQETPELVHTRSTFDEMAVEAASHMGRMDMADYLAEKGAPVSTCTAVLLGREDLVKEAMAADPKVVYERGAHDIAIIAYTAYGNQQTAIAERLMKGGAGVNERALGATALHLAAQKGYTDLAALLIDHGADANLSLKIKGTMQTPLEMAVKAKQPVMEKLLRDRGAK